MFSLWDQKGAERALNVNFLCSLHSGAGAKRGEEEGPRGKHTPHTGLMAISSKCTEAKIMRAQDLGPANLEWVSESISYKLRKKQIPWSLWVSVSVPVK